MMQLQGAFTALITPMHGDGTVDYEGFRSLIRFQLEKGIHGLVPLGTTGETPTLERDEQDRLIEIAVQEAKGRVPVIVGVGSNATAKTIENAKRARALGADGILVVTPYYNKPTNEGIYRHFSAIADATDAPILIYNIASRTGKNIDVQTMERLSRIPTVIGVKEASGDLAQMGDIIQMVAQPRRAEGKPFAVLSGDDAFTLALCALGGDGVVSVVSNLVPDRVSSLAKACLAGNFAKARELHYSLLPLFKGAFIETNPIPIKTAMGWAGLPAGPCRLPLCDLEAANIPKLKSALAAADIAVR
ncbi:4-hydroxy-tetrahydrodipicolinate synthase [Gracilinema caldarium]|uniref:4-hydroxy-tetrahydrodipicolinate synthase n=1 Tax=Gracilinema caldarium (strain ATCC 51460 / DSM 7334 / H1) TaxID=744872 RepID=F8F2I4_GRAC1|nr:4-hydroxy-tetrahydrodipicolinate synthase [Gracilinema caldarium]AEJ19099.1 Dihydrodipicolinate synthase [Gracilinema caldarium DSM 7334]